MTSECVDLARSAGAVLAFKLIRTARFLAADAAHQYRSCIGGATACFLGRLGGQHCSLSQNRVYAAPLNEQVGRARRCQCSRSDMDTVTVNG